MLVCHSQGCSALGVGSSNLQQYCHGRSMGAVEAASQHQMQHQCTGVAFSCCKLDLQRARSGSAWRKLWKRLCVASQICSSQNFLWRGFSHVDFIVTIWHLPLCTCSCFIQTSGFQEFSGNETSLLLGCRRPISRTSKIDKTRIGQTGGKPIYSDWLRLEWLEKLNGGGSREYFQH